MSWTAPRTYVTGEVETATIFNTDIRDNLKALTPDSVGTTVGGVQTAIGANNGLTMKLRVGTTPYEFITLHYDSTYAKWVSGVTARNVCKSTTTADATFTSTVWKQFVATNDTKKLIIPWLAFDTAGLLPQIKIDAQAAGTATGAFTDAFIRPALLTGNAGNPLAYASVFTSLPVQVLNASDHLRLGAWTTIDGGYVVRDMLGLGAFDGKVTGTGTLTITVSEVTMSLRWISA
jgi:hypothetical protein